MTQQDADAWEADDHEQRLYRYRELVIKARGEQSNQFDKAILTLSGGALVFSVNFLDKWQTTPSFWIVTSWIAYVIALCSTLISFKFSEWLQEETIETIDASLRKEDSSNARVDVWSRRVRYTNGMALICFLFGTVLLLMFALENRRIG